MKTATKTIQFCNKSEYKLIYNLDKWLHTLQDSILFGQNICTQWKDFLHNPHIARAESQLIHVQWYKVTKEKNYYLFWMKTIAPLCGFYSKDRKYRKIYSSETGGWQNNTHFKIYDKGLFQAVSMPVQAVKVNLKAHLRYQIASIFWMICTCSV